MALVIWLLACTVEIAPPPPPPPPIEPLTLTWYDVHQTCCALGTVDVVVTQVLDLNQGYAAGLTPEWGALAVATERALDKHRLPAGSVSAIEGLAALAADPGADLAAQRVSLEHANTHVAALIPTHAGGGRSLAWARDPSGRRWVQREGPVVSPFDGTSGVWVTP